jgi:DNA replication ATP-dependent helicase Dna2
LSETYQKTNAQEAEVVLDIILNWKKIIDEKKLGWTIGVITPFRAQIAGILHMAHKAGVNLNGITVDTVERYQGGARDIIIMSCAVNNNSAMSRIVSINEEGIDRKLNVAVTRARQQFVLIGNQSVLMEQKAYRELIKMSFRVS